MSNVEDSPPPGGKATVSLDRERLFFLGCRDAFLDGQIDSVENEFLRELQRTLQVSPARAMEIAKMAEASARNQGGASETPLDPERLFRSALRVAWSDGHLEQGEGQLLEELAKLLQLDPPRIQALVQEFRKVEPPEPEPVVAPPSPGLTAEELLLGEIRRWQQRGLIGSILAEQLSQLYQGRDSALPVSARAVALPLDREPDANPVLFLEEVEEESAPRPPPRPPLPRPPRPAEPIPPETDADLDEPGGSGLITFISLLGAILMGIGAIVFVAANWHKIGPFFKVCLVLMAVTTTYVGAYELCLKGNRARETGEGLVFLGGLLFAAGIALIAQIYHLSIHWYLGILVWTLAITPMTFAVNSFPIFLLSLLTLGAWTTLEQASGGSCLSWLPLLPAGLRMTNPLFPPLMGALAGFGGRHFRSTLALLIAAFYGWAWFLAVPISHEASFSLHFSLVYGLLVLVLGLRSDPEAPWQQAARSVTDPIAFLAVIVSAFSLCFVDAARHLVEGITAHYSPEGSASVLIVWLVHFLILLLAVPRMGEESGPEISRPARAAVACTVISGLPWLIAFTGPYPVAFCFNGLMMGFCLATVKAGVLRRSGTLINIGVLGVFLWIGSRCLEWFVDMHNVGLSLMLGGGFLLFVSLQIERWRQRLHREMAMAEGGES